MLSPKDRAELDQSVKAISETLTPLWWGLYEGCRRQGFNDEQAMAIILQYIATSCQRGPVGPDIEDEDSDA